MLKGVKKGIKKKIKGKKDKKEDDLFDPEQLEKYKRELEEAKRVKQLEDEAAGIDTTASSSGGGGGHEEDEEWLRFKQLTSGVDCLVNKVSTDLDRIKESSFFQRNKPSEQNKQWASERPANAIIPDQEKAEGQWVPADVEDHGGEEEHKVEEEEPAFEDAMDDGTFKVPDSPDMIPVELDDSLFDTDFVDAIATGEIKLAYIPDSPTQDDEDDPFNTQAYDTVVKKIEEDEKKAKRQVNLGNTVDFLTGKGGKTGIERPRTKAAETKAKARPRPHAVNLLGDFDDAPGAPPPDYSRNNKGNNEKTEKATDIFDQILDSPSRDTSSLDVLDFLPGKATEEKNGSSSASSKKPSPKKEDNGIKDVISEFDIIGQLESTEAEPLPVGIPTSIPSSIAALLTISTPEPAAASPVPPQEEEDEWDEEFAALAAESIQKHQPPPVEEPEEPEEDPFDTSFVDKSAAHGKCELKMIENEILGEVQSSADKGGEKSSGTGVDDDDDFDFNPRMGESPPKTLKIQNAPKANPLEDLSPITIKAPAIQPHVKAAGPQLVETGEARAVSADEDIDPFDTSTLETVLPGKAELKLLEEELLSSVEQAKVGAGNLPDHIVSAILKKQQTEDDFDFDPRKEEATKHMLDLHDVEHHKFDTVSHVLTPQQEIEVEIDPFDTSAVAASGLIPGALELKLLESELVSPTKEAPPCVPAITTAPAPKMTRTFSDEEFDPRCGVPAPTLAPKPPPTTEDIFDSTMDFAVDQPLTPSLEMAPQAALEPKLCPANVDDPFDTSGIQIENYLAKSELKQMEEELLNAPPQPARTLPVVVAVEYKKPPQQSAPPKPPSPEPPRVPHPLEAMTPVDDSFKPLTPTDMSMSGVISVFNPSSMADPFDTSIAEGVIPGKTEIKLLEKELGVGAGTGRRLSDDDFDPRGPNHPSRMVSQPLTPLPMQPQLKPTIAESMIPQTASSEPDPFDTSAAETVMPGKAELKALEQELL